jgi:hypothetical protein
MSSSIWEIGHLLAMRSSVCVSQASGSTSFIFAVCRRVAMVAHVLPPPSLPAKTRYCLGSDGPFDNVGIDFDTAVEEEAPENLPSGGGVADRLGQFLTFPRSAAIPFPRA